MAGVHGTWSGYADAEWASIQNPPPIMGTLTASPSGPPLIHGFLVDALFLTNGSPCFLALVGAPANLVFTLHYVDDNGDHVDLASGDAQVESYGPGGIGTTGWGNFWNWGGLASFGVNFTLGKVYPVTWT